MAESRTVLVARFLLLAALCVPQRGQAEAASSDTALFQWSRLAAARGNRVLAEQIDAATVAKLLALLSENVAPCDCLPRRIRWAWPLANPSSPSQPRLVVSFDDRARDNHKLALFERYALLVPAQSGYAVSSVFNLGRPSAKSGGTLHVQLQPRRDLDADGQLDISLTVAELWPTQSLCGVLKFETSADVLRFEQSECAEN